MSWAVRQRRCKREQLRLLLVLGLSVLALAAGCDRKVPSGAVVVTQIPAGMTLTNDAPTLLDQRYPAGSRVVLTMPPFAPANVRVLSKGLLAAGGAVICPSGTRVLFAGKAEVSAEWQIYEAAFTGRRPIPMTSIRGGAMEPAVVSNGDFVFSSPVPKPGQTWSGSNTPALFVQSRGIPPRQLTFGRAAVEPTALADGRILFVSARLGNEMNDAQPSLGLFTINPDGTEFTSFALDRDGAPIIRRPRELFDGRIGFLAGTYEAPQHLRPETVRMARPFASRASLEGTRQSHVTSIEAGPDGNALACFKADAGGNGCGTNSMAVHVLGRDGAKECQVLFDDAAWDEIEAIPARPPVRPVGHISSIVPGKKSGTILCLNAVFTRGPSVGSLQTKPVRVRVLTTSRVLGEIPLQEDGSFMAEVPADRPFGLETLNSQGQVLQRLPPVLWVRPGENRTCIGCHEPSNRSPRNHRPRAVTMPAALLTENPQTLSHSTY